MSGFLGCRGQSLKLTSTLKSDVGIMANYTLGVSSVPIIGGITKLAGSDIISIWTVDYQDYPLVEPMGNARNALKVSLLNPFTSGDIALITDCNAHTLFKISKTSSDKNGMFLNHAIESNSTAAFQHIYNPDASVYRAVAQTFYIAASEVNPKTYSLWRYCLPSCYGGAAATAVKSEELIKGVDRIKVFYGIDQNEDGAIDIYKASDTVTSSEWTQVISVKLHLLLASLKANMTTGERQPINFMGETISSEDGKLRVPFSTVITLRNRAP